MLNSIRQTSEQSLFDGNLLPVIWYIKCTIKQYADYTNALTKDSCVLVLRVAIGWKININYRLIDNYDGVLDFVIVLLPCLQPMMFP